MISNTSSTENDIVTDPQQESRAKLRESFLKAISELTGESCSILTYEQTSLTATFAGWKSDGTEVLVRDLKTPYGVKLPAALLRGLDVLSIQFDGNILLP